MCFYDTLLTNTILQLDTENEGGAILGIAGMGRAAGAQAQPRQRSVPKEELANKRDADHQPDSHAEECEVPPQV